MLSRCGGSEGLAFFIKTQASVDLIGKRVLIGVPGCGPRSTGSFDCLREAAPFSTGSSKDIERLGIRRRARLQNLLRRLIRVTTIAQRRIGIRGQGPGKLKGGRPPARVPLPSDLVLPLRVCALVQLVQGISKAGMIVRLARTKLAGMGETGRRLSPIFLELVGESLSRERGGGIGIEGGRLLEMGDGLLQASLHEQGTRQVGVISRRARIEAHSPPQVVDRLLGSAQVQKSIPQVKMSPGLLLVEAEGFLQRPHRLVEPSLLQQGLAQLGMGTSHPRIKPNADSQLAHGRIPLAGDQQGIAQVETSPSIGGGAADGLLEMRESPVQLPCCQEMVGQIVFSEGTRRIQMKIRCGAEWTGGAWLAGLSSVRRAISTGLA